MSNIITLEVCAGFANRLRALVSGICYAEEYNKKLFIYWNLHPTCFAKLDDIIYINSLPKYVTIFSSFLPYELMMVHKQEDLETLPERIKSYAHFYTKSSERFNFHLRNIKFNVKELTNKSIVGIHIRRTDHTKCIENSPINFFINEINKEQSDKKFYLATDCDITKRYLKVMYGDRIITSDIVLKRTSKEGVKGAIQDFINLANCSKIIGTKYSSFSEMAALYGNIPLIINEDI
jgi:hypothetical protein